MMTEMKSQDQTFSEKKFIRKKQVFLCETFCYSNKKKMKCEKGVWQGRLIR